MPSRSLTVLDLARVIYSAGKTFDGLSTGRLDTESFLRTGDPQVLTSRADHSLLLDLRDAAQYAIDYSTRVIDSQWLRGLNSTMSRTASMWPGELRQKSHHIGVKTPLGDHEPPALTDESLTHLTARSVARENSIDSKAVALFMDLARAQPFSDGNKRTALFAANALLLGNADLTMHTRILGVPLDASNPDSSVKRFHTLLADFYINDNRAPLANLMIARGFTTVA